MVPDSTEGMGSPPTAADGAPRLSVIVPVFNRPEPLRRLFEALASQEFPRSFFEVLVCDDGSTEDISGVVRAAAEELGLDLIYLRQSRGGPGRARNLGLHRARGEVVVFTDSDCVPAPGWLAAIDRALASPGTQVVGGAITYRAADTLSGRCVNFLNATSLACAGGADPRSLVHVNYYPRGMNVALRRSLALAAGGFPPCANGEDVLFVHRALRVVPKESLVFVPEASVLHNERRDLAQAFSVSVRRGTARFRVLRPHGMHHPIHAVPSALVVCLIAWAVLAAAGSTLAAAAAVPLGLYAAALMALGLQGAADLRDWRALGAVPIYAAALHLGHGVGYLGGAVGLLRTGGEEVASRTPRADSLSGWEAGEAHSAQVTSLASASGGVVAR